MRSSARGWSHLESGLKLSLRLTAGISPTEDPEKVAFAVCNIVGDADYSLEKSREMVTLTSGDPRSIRRVHDQFRDRRVRDTARKLLLRGREQDTLHLFFNRQAAYAGIVAVSSSESESPLGPIYMELECDRPEAVVDWLTLH